jgi:hypothetical protein
MMMMTRTYFGFIDNDDTQAQADSESAGNSGLTQSAQEFELTQK